MKRFEREWSFWTNRREMIDLGGHGNSAITDDRHMMGEG